MKIEDVSSFKLPFFSPYNLWMDNEHLGYSISQKYPNKKIHCIYFFGYYSFHEDSPEIYKEKIFQTFLNGEMIETPTRLNKQI